MRGARYAFAFKTTQRLSLVVAAACATSAVLLALLPPDWIEELLGFEPDGGNGFAEVALIIVLAVVAVALAAGVACTRWRPRASIVTGRSPGSLS
jgi:hypothetical protein